MAAHVLGIDCSGSGCGRGGQGSSVRNLRAPDRGETARRPGFPRCSVTSPVSPRHALDTRPMPVSKGYSASIIAVARCRGWSWPDGYGHPSDYWHIGGSIVERRQAEGWGTAVIDRLGKDPPAAFPGIAGCSRLNKGQDDGSGHMVTLREDTLPPSRISRTAVEFKKVARSPSSRTFAAISSTMAAAPAKASRADSPSPICRCNRPSTA